MDCIEFRLTNVLHTYRISRNNGRGYYHFVQKKFAPKLDKCGYYFGAVLIKFSKVLFQFFMNSQIVNHFFSKQTLGDFFIHYYLLLLLLANKLRSHLTDALKKETYGSKKSLGPDHLCLL